MGYIESIYDTGNGWRATVITVSPRHRRSAEAKTIEPQPTPADVIVEVAAWWLSPASAAQSGLRVLGINPKRLVGSVDAQGRLCDQQVSARLVDLIHQRNCLLAGDTRGRERLLRKIRRLLDVCGVAGCKVKR